MSGVGSGHLPHELREQISFLPTEGTEPFATGQMVDRGEGAMWAVVVLLYLFSLKLCLTPCNHLDCGHQALLSMRFPRQEYWNGFPLPSPGDLPNPGSKSASPALAGGFFTSEPPGKPRALVER